MADVKEIFINIEVIDIYGGIEAVGIASFYSEGGSFYQNTSKSNAVNRKYNGSLQNRKAIDVYGEATDEFHERFDGV